MSKNELVLDSTEARQLAREDGNAKPGCQGAASGLRTLNFGGITVLDVGGLLPKNQPQFMRIHQVRVPR